MKKMSINGTVIKGTSLNKFKNYVNGFYGNRGIYSKDFERPFTKEIIEKAIICYIEKMKEKGFYNDPEYKHPQTWGDGDSIDRERIRDIVIYSFKWTKYKD
jgi:hypothetical protein